MKHIYTMLLLALTIFCKAQETKTGLGQLAKLPKSKGELSGNVGCELQDKNGNIWFSRSGDGAYRYDGISFTHFTTKDGLSNNQVNDIIEDHAGNILFATNNGVCYYNGRSFSNLVKNDDLNKTTAWSLLEDKAGNIWIGTMQRGVYYYDGKSLTNFLNPEGPASHSGARQQAIRHILQDKSGNIWFCSWNGGGVWCYDGKIFTNYIPSAAYYLSNEDGRSLNNITEQNTASYMPKPFTNYMPTDCIHDDMIFSVAEDKTGNLWFATRRHGACRYDGSAFNSFREKEGFVSKGIYAILQDKKGNIWFGTENRGLWCYDGHSFKNFTTKDGLVNNSVFSILEDKRGYLWFGTRGFGLSCYDGKNFTTLSE